jgi:hypothetical protein
VQWLERDYQYMTMGHRGDIPVLEDSRRLIGGGGHVLWWDRDAEGEVIPSVGHAQPLYMLKNDEGWAAPMRWDAFEGPTMPMEELMTVGQADEDRPDWYRQRLYYHYTDSGMPVPEEIQAWYDAWDAAREERNRLANERYAESQRSAQEYIRAYLEEQFSPDDDQLAESMSGARFEGIIATTTAEDSSE